MHAMEGIDPGFHTKVSPGDFLLCGANFGCGSSREHAPIALSKLGIKAILAPSFARIFYRNAVDGGYLLPIEIERSTLEQIDDGNIIDIDLQNYRIINLDKNDKSYPIKPLSDMIIKIVEAGGLLYYSDDEKGSAS
jgi:3-isopropylmalate/(R)-2-methylmalate dehydratase small subunit